MWCFLLLIFTVENLNIVSTYSKFPKCEKEAARQNQVTVEVFDKEAVILCEAIPVISLPKNTLHVVLRDDKFVCQRSLRY